MKNSQLFSTLVWGSSALLASAQNLSAPDNCTCFKTNSSSAGYFLYHTFIDYRNLNTSIGQYSVPEVVTDADDTSHALATSDYFLSDTFTNFWQSQTWNNSNSGANVFMVNSANNIYIQENDDPTGDFNTSLVLRTTRLADFQSAAEIDSVEDGYNYLSIRFLGRVQGAAGACAGIFTYRQFGDDPQEDIEEADIEILTKDPQTKVQYTNQPSVDTAGNAVSQATVNGTNPNKVDWTKWNNYRMDWMPDKTSWYVNGKRVAQISYQVPTGAAQVIINMWGDGGDWTGNMTEGDAAYLEIQWIDMVYNLTDTDDSTDDASTKVKKSFSERAARLFARDDDDEEKCSVVCSVDNGVTNVGTPILGSNSMKTVISSVMLWGTVLSVGIFTLL